MSVRLIMGVAALFIAAAVLPAQAETIEVTIEGFQFSPNAIEAKVGDTIVWTNKDSARHTTTARDDSWDLQIDPDATVSQVVTATGSFDFFCRFHPNMTGQVVASAE